MKPTQPLAQCEGSATSRFAIRNNYPQHLLQTLKSARGQVAVIGALAGILMLLTGLMLTCATAKMTATTTTVAPLQLD